MNNLNFFSNPMLIGAMELVKKNKTPENLKVFMDELMHAKLLSAVVITPPPVLDKNGMAKLTPESKISIPMLPGPNEKKYFMAFTDVEEIKKVSENRALNILPFGMKDYAVMLNNTDVACDGLVINPGSNGPIVSRTMIAAMLDSSMKKPAEPSTEE